MIFFLKGVVGDDEFTLAVFGTFIITNFVYFGVGSVYSYFDITGTPKFLKKYKVRFLNYCYSYGAVFRLKQRPYLDPLSIDGIYFL